MIVSQLLVTLAVHAHPAPAVTRIVPVESSAPTLSLAGEMVNEHAAGGAGVGAGAGGAPARAPEPALEWDLAPEAASLSPRPAER